MIIAITGTIGSGKSSVASFFRAKNYEVLDTDKMVHAYYEINHPIYEWLVNKFGKHILDKNKNIDRKALAHLVFNNPIELKNLEDVIFPRIREEIEHIKAKTEQKIVFIEVPLLFEAKMDDLFDKIIAVDAYKDIRHERLIAKGFSMPDIQKREARQMKGNEKKRRADIVVNNNKDLKHLKKQLEIVERGEIYE